MMEVGTPSAEFLAAFRAHADPLTAHMSFDQFMNLALYDPQVGYYRQDRTRVGYAAGTDFYTSSTSGPIFGEMVAAACVSLLGGRPPAEFTFVELGAETSHGILHGVSHPFGQTRVIRIGEKWHLSGRCIVFSNELFDAQPFRRFVFRAGAWHERGVALVEGVLKEIEIVSEIPAALPVDATEGYLVDAPLAAASLASAIAAQPWEGLFVACDYGKEWLEIIEACPAGTGRGYWRHQQTGDLLQRPGDQDLTCHVCWDWIGGALSRHGFAEPILQSQESFFIHHAGDFIARVTTDDAARFSPRKLSLLQLLHPSHLGQKFQVLHSWRG
jgi:SAM-dependent MidA family methyltransferase